ncbi:flagellar basal body rod protein FlgB [Paraburkholderia sp. SOS3]|jgi:flagellar basal-body rod protein FlgB|uniref:flagellar basal body rod protein FlgB n=1 Tax=Paraburkholderia sp. SOS3 TaxID=1926494 RepID=UPI00094761E0|nr:flagellar basal body rod protein FlgB [Paraburkholderia sp. SOS3]APR37298.1 flagellar basal body rod protein FlgB [Paraburkholderia sp. SOS3]
MLDRLDQNFAFNKEALDVRAYRQEVLSSNIANADTPNYKARDINFSSSLAGALRKANGESGFGASPLQMAQPAGVTTGMTLATTEPGHMAGKAKLIPTGGPAEDYGRLKYRIPVQPALDGNTVDLDSERVQFADNTLHLESGMTLVSSQIKGLLSAITSGS